MRPPLVTAGVETFYLSGRPAQKRFKLLKIKGKIRIWKQVVRVWKQIAGEKKRLSDGKKHWSGEKQRMVGDW